MFCHLNSVEVNAYKKRPKNKIAPITTLSPNDVVIPHNVVLDNQKICDANILDANVKVVTQSSRSIFDIISGNDLESVQVNLMPRIVSNYGTATASKSCALPGSSNIIQRSATRASKISRRSMQSCVSHIDQRTVGDSTGFSPTTSILKSIHRSPLLVSARRLQIAKTNYSNFTGIPKQTPFK